MKVGILNFGFIKILAFFKVFFIYEVEAVYFHPSQGT